jgi:hypothetical protein
MHHYRYTRFKFLRPRMGGACGDTQTKEGAQEEADVEDAFSSCD